MKTIGVVTVSRSDYGIYLPVLRALVSDGSLSLALFVGGTHLRDDFGRTIDLIRADGFEPCETIDYLSSADTPLASATSLGRAVSGFAEAFGRTRPDLLVVLGDRFDMFAAAVAALPQSIPIAHVHGGELTEGAIDDAWRHALTKMSHLHFVATDDARRRVLQLGEEPWRVQVTGAPGLDNLRGMTMCSRAELAGDLGVSLDAPPLLVTFHPETLAPGTAAGQVDELLAALDVFRGPIVITHPNADAEGSVIRRAVDRRGRTAANVFVFANLGTQRYFSLMACAAVMVGNSSSGIIEAASFGLPVVNVGDRQKGRQRGANVLDVACDRGAIASAIVRATGGEFRSACAGMANPYGDGHAAERILGVLRSVPIEPLCHKRFIDLPACHG